MPGLDSTVPIKQTTTATYNNENVTENGLISITITVYVMFPRQRQ